MALQFNVNYRPYLVVNCSEAALSAARVAPVSLCDKYQLALYALRASSTFISQAEMCCFLNFKTQLIGVNDLRCVALIMYDMRHYAYNANGTDLYVLHSH